jgi:hypothetical protein
MYRKEMLSKQWLVGMNEFTQHLTMCSIHSRRTETRVFAKIPFRLLCKEFGLAIILP